MLSGCASTKKQDVMTENLDLLNTDLEKAGLDKVYFAFDSSSISNADIEVLVKQAAWIQNHSDVDFAVEGHCDDRGTREYNLALGERRANAVKKYLVNQAGINSDKITTISYGKERPAVLGSTEEVWALNRRAVTVVVSK